jgi:AcrR family transcriptional regulator
MSTETYSRLGTEKKQKIIHAAIDNFVRSGYSGTSMEAVAESAGVAKGALYRYFSSKKDLFMLVVDHLVEDMDHYAQEFLKSHSETNVFTTLYDHLVAIYDIQKRFSMHHEVLCNILYQEHIDFKGEVLAKFGKLTTQYTRLVLQRGIARGEVRDDIDVDAAAFMIDSVIDRFHDGVWIPFLDHGFGLYQQPQEAINRKAALITDAFRRAFGKQVAGDHEHNSTAELTKKH